MSAATYTKQSYVYVMQHLGRALGRSGALAYLDRKSKNARFAHWMRSLFCIYDMEGLVALDVPWWSYDAIAEVDEILKSKANARVFEYGSGASTVWLARRAAHVTSVEHHPAWHEKVQEFIKRHQNIGTVEIRLIHPDDQPASDSLYTSEKPRERGQSFERYAREIETDQDPRYDVIVIDGRARAACLKHAQSMLADDGVIVFDNSRRTRYRRAIEASGLEARVFRGLTPSLPYADQTTLLSRKHKTSV